MLGRVRLDSKFARFPRRQVAAASYRVMHAPEDLEVAEMAEVQAEAVVTPARQTASAPLSASVVAVAAAADGECRR